MKLVKCERGHYYDAERYSRCPRCQSGDTGIKDTVVKKKKADPPIGWLACIAGHYYGNVYPLKSGKNTVGADKNMDINLEDARELSSACQMILIYDADRKKFYAQAGNARELSYVNEQVVLMNKELQARDRIKIGNEEFLFIPLCGTDFSWEEK